MKSTQKKLRTIARLMQTKEEAKIKGAGGNFGFMDDSSIFSSKAWLAKKEATARRVAKKQGAAHERALKRKEDAKKAKK